MMSNKIGLKFDSIPYLDKFILDEYANVKIVSKSSNDYVLVNHLALASWSSVFASSYEDNLEDFVIITDFLKDDLEILHNFVHEGQAGHSSIFNSFGINMEKFEEVLEEFHEEIIAPPKVIKKLKMKRLGRPRKDLPTGAEKINDSIVVMEREYTQALNKGTKVGPCL